MCNNIVIKLENSHSWGIYKIFASVDIEKEDNEGCKDLSKIKHEKKWSTKLFRQISKNSKYMIEVKDYAGHEDRCLHYVYWIYDKTAKKWKSVSDYEKIKDIIKVFKDNKAKYITSIKILYEDYKKNECTEYLDFLDSDFPDYFRIEEVYVPQNLLSILEYRKSKNFSSDINSEISLNAVSNFVMNKNFELGKEASNVKYNSYKGFYSVEIKENGVKKEKIYYGLFTSLGSMFNRKTKRKKENFNNIFENEEEHLLEHMSERRNVKSTNRRLHVAYHLEGGNVG
ncbi:PIR Superfamily Protein [Plasmodium ovale curtisi]|uniref:PIR Superfamily Protein n=1 Tax=Plasmodium ovale curtisi TaxID=864141 RepID=A0A1A8X8F7_PLAOA|nr:PIR Superfamily Protein [Plasmodium ovale curtisi]